MSGLLEVVKQFLEFLVAGFARGGGLRRLRRLTHGGLFLEFFEGLALEVGVASFLFDFSHEVMSELEAEQQGSGFRGLDAAPGKGVENFVDGQEDGGLAVERWKSDRLALLHFAWVGIELGTWGVMMAEGAAVAGGGVAFVAGFERVDTFGGHGFLSVQSS